MPRFFLADPSLITVSGHCWSYLRSLIQPVQEAGFEPVVLGNRSVCAELQVKAGVLPLFQHWCDDRFGPARLTAAAHSKAIRSDLAKAARRFEIASSDILLLNSLRHWPLLGVIEWLEALPAARRPLVALALHFTAFPDPEGPSDSVEYFRRAFRRIEVSPVRDRLVLMADSQELIDEYQSISRGLQFSLAPIPHAPDQPPAADSTDGLIRLGCIGEARENKGFHLFPYLIRRVVDAPGCEQVRFHLHTFAHNRETPFYRRIEPRLRHPRVTQHREMLDDEQYERLLASLDIVILPYTRLNYHAQTSGVFSEAIALGKTVVCPRGTWMARQTAEFEAGVTFAPDDAEDLAQQTLAAIVALPGFAAGAANRAQRWRIFHNPHRWLDLIWERYNPIARNKAAGPSTRGAGCKHPA